MVHLQHVFDYKLLPQHTPLIYKRLDFQRLSVQICRAFSSFCFAHSFAARKSVLPISFLLISSDIWILDKSQYPCLPPNISDSTDSILISIPPLCGGTNSDERFYFPPHCAITVSRSYTTKHDRRNCRNLSRFKTAF